MMNRIFLISFFSIAIIVAKAQNIKSQFGWYHLLPGSKTKVLISYDRSSGFTANVKYNTDEVLLVFETKNNLGYAVDIDGRIVLIDNMNLVEKIDTAGRVVKMVETIDVSLNKKLSKGNNVWLIGFNSAANTAKILLTKGEIVEIPKSSYEDIREYFDHSGENNKFLPAVEN